MKQLAQCIKYRFDLSCCLVTRPTYRPSKRTL